MAGNPNEVTIKVTTDLGQLEQDSKRIGSALDNLTKQEIAAAKLAGTHYATLRAQRLGLASDLESVTARIRAADVATASSSAAAGAAVGRTGNQLRMAQASAMIFERQMGIQMPRAINAMLARSELIGPALTAAFGIGVLFLFVDNIGKVIKAFGDAEDALGGFGAGWKGVMAGAIKDSDDALTHFRGLTLEAKIATGHLLIAQTQMAITAMTATAAMMPLIEAGRKLQITWGQALLGPAGMAIGFGKAVKSMMDMEAATKPLTALFDRLNEQIAAVGKLQEEKNKEDERAAKAVHEHAAAVEHLSAAQQQQIELLSWLNGTGGGSAFSGQTGPDAQWENIRKRMADADTAYYQGLGVCRE